MTLVKIAQLSSMSKVLKVPGPGIQVLACSLPLGSHFSTSYLSLLMLQPYTAFYSGGRQSLLWPWQWCVTHDNQICHKSWPTLFLKLFDTNSQYILMKEIVKQTTVIEMKNLLKTQKIEYRCDYLSQVVCYLLFRH